MHAHTQVQISGPELRENEDDLPPDEREALEKKRVIIMAYIRTLEVRSFIHVNVCIYVFEEATRHDYGIHACIHVRIRTNTYQTLYFEDVLLCMVYTRVACVCVCARSASMSIA